MHNPELEQWYKLCYRRTSVMPTSTNHYVTELFNYNGVLRVKTNSLHFRKHFHFNSLTLKVGYSHY